MEDTNVEPCRKDFDGTLTSVIDIIRFDENRVCRIRGLNEIIKRFKQKRLDEGIGIRRLFSAYPGNDPHIKRMMREIFKSHPLTFTIMLDVIDDPEVDETTREAAEEIINIFAAK